MYSEAAAIRVFKKKTKRSFHEIGTMDSDMIESIAKTQVEEIIAEYDLDVKIKEIVLTGSRCRGMETEGSDIDVVVYYTGSEREDYLFDLLHGDEIILGGAVLDINPLSQKKRGSLAEYLTGAESYLLKKKAAIV